MISFLTSPCSLSLLLLLISPLSYPPVIVSLIAIAVQEEEQRQLAHSVMGKKTKRLYDRMKHGIGQNDSKAAALRAKAEALEAEAKGADKKGKGKGRAASAQPDAPAAKKAKRK